MSELVEPTVTQEFYEISNRGARASTSFGLQEASFCRRPGCGSNDKEHTHPVEHGEPLDRLALDQIGMVLGAHIDVAEVAYLLGYGDSNSFDRAFRTWEGKTRSQLRAGLKRPVN